MAASPRTESGEQGVLAARLAIPEAQHPRVPEPTGKTALARSGPLNVATVGEEATVLDALKVMAERDTAAVAVVSPAGIVGIFSERDHARNCLPANRTAKDTPVVDIMTPFVAGVAPADTLRRCQSLMNERHVTHLAVLDQGRLVGLLSEADLLAARIAYFERIFQETEMDQKLLFLRGTYSC
ncbi:CBS domain-containing protein [Rhodoblastus sp.]|uniref:CBS domain-containing protein n=1 Tax=Rhodoblastus sp. TaxID=1962975 RepID=UPI003F95A340